MTREEFIEKWGCCKKEGGGITLNSPMEPFPEISTDLDSLFLPRAEGAEEILKNVSNKYSIVMSKMSNEIALEAMQEFATLHAQRLAEKMVSEKLGEELIKFLEWDGITDKLAREFVVGRYLKTR